MRTLFRLILGLAFTAASYTDATAQDSSPWGDLDDSPSQDEKESPEEPQEEPEAIDPNSNPWDDEEETEPDVPEETPEAESAAPTAPSEAEDASAQESGQGALSNQGKTIEIAPQGLRIAQLKGGSGVWFSEEAVLGVDGNVHVTTVHARYAAKNFAIVGHIPFAGYRSPEGPDSNLGNLNVGAWYFMEGGSMIQGAGLEVHANLGTSAWTWANTAAEIWPSYGVSAVWQIQYNPGHFSEKLPDFTIMTRFSGGVVIAQSYDPFPPVYLNIQGSIGFDLPVHPIFGLVGETTLRYWDVSPAELAGLVRVEPMPGFRLRTGIALPVGVWSGLAPTGSPPGIREVTWASDVLLAF